jgi:hypothetical protein
MQPTQRCKEHEILYGRFRADLRVYVDVTRRLESCKPEQFKETYAAAESARAAFQRARETLDAHVIVHGCER